MEVDPRSTARLLLSWRDELFEAGWAPVDNPALSSRLHDVCAAEKAGPPLPSGFADRCAIVLGALASRPALPCAHRRDTSNSRNRVPPEPQDGLEG